MYFIDVFLYVVVLSICWKCIFLQLLRTLYKEHHKKNLAIMLCHVNICNFGASFNECQGFVFLQEFQCFLPWVILACSQFVFLTCLFVCPFGSHSCADWPPAYQPFSVVELFFFCLPSVCSQNPFQPEKITHCVHHATFFYALWCSAFVLFFFLSHLTLLLLLSIFCRDLTENWTLAL